MSASSPLHEPSYADIRTLERLASAADAMRLAILVAVSDTAQAQAALRSLFLAQTIAARAVTSGDSQPDAPPAGPTGNTH